MKQTLSHSQFAALLLALQRDKDSIAKSFANRATIVEVAKKYKVTVGAFKSAAQALNITLPQRGVAIYNGPRDPAIETLADMVLRLALAAGVREEDLGGIRKLASYTLNSD
jgi:hypothetical protein